MNRIIRALEAQNALSGGFGGGLGPLGPTVVPGTPGSSGGGFDPVLVLGGIGVVAVIGLIVYEWYRHKHAKQEGRAVKDEA